MKKIHSDLKNGIIKVQAENLDDLWYLSSIVDPGDFVKGKTIRKIKIGAEGDRNMKIVKKPVFLKIQAEKIEFSKSSDYLRISGKIKEGPEDVRYDSYHTFNVSDGTVISIIKRKWLKFQIEKLNDACSEKLSKILILVHDREEGYFALMKKYGYELLSHVSGNVSKKADLGKTQTGNFYSLLIKQIQAYDEKHNFSNVIVASPAFWKEEFLKNLKDDKLKKKIITATCSSVGKNGINEVLRRPETISALKEERISEEMNFVEKLLNEISKDGNYSYGTVETMNSANAGAVSELLITDSFIMKSREQGKYSEIDYVLKAVENAKGKILIVSSLHDGGKKLDGLGGIGAILRYRV